MTLDLAEARQRGFGKKVGFGRKPALLVVDFAVAFTQPQSALGSDVSAQIAQSNRLIAAARAVGAPIYFSTIAYSDPGREAGIWLDKIEGLRQLVLGAPEVQQDPRLDCTPEDRILVKRYASCFFGTLLDHDLRQDGIDTLILAGCATSGCVRASAVDACQHGYRVIVAREATADRLLDAHEQSLADIDLKYGDVWSVDRIVSELGAIEQTALKTP